MKGFFPAVAKASEGETSTTPSWVKVKREKAETLAKISELSAVAFNAQHGDLAALVDLNPVKGYVSKAAGVVCASKGNIYSVAPWPDNRRSLVWTKVGDISASAGAPNLVVCLEEGCFQEVITITCASVTTVQLNDGNVADVASFLCSLLAVAQATSRGI